MTVTKQDIEVKWYQISEMTTIHDFIEVKRGSSIIKIMEAGAYGFADVEIKRDTIIIKYLQTVVYKLSDKAFNYKIKLDTTIRIDYWREKVEEKGKIKK